MSRLVAGLLVLIGLLSVVLVISVASFNYVLLVSCPREVVSLEHQLAMALHDLNEAHVALAESSQRIADLESAR